MSAWARPGVKVVCVDASSVVVPDTGLQLNRKYVIESVFAGGPALGPNGEFRDGLQVSLVGVSKPGGIGGYGVYRFRPVTTRTQEQDVAIFRHLLDKAPVLEGV